LERYEINSDMKLAIKAPNKKNRVKTRKVIAAAKSLRMTSSAKKAKCPVTLVVNVLKDKIPVIFTFPATKDNKVANRRL
jgi:hypothetical protein